MIRNITASLAIMAMAGWATSAGAAPLAEAESNDTFATAQDINGSFDLSSDVRIEDENGVNTSTFIPHVEIFGGGDDSYDMFTFDVTLPGSIGIFDIDCAEAEPGFTVAECPDPGGSMDSVIWLYDSDSFAAQIGTNDDAGFDDTGSTPDPFDSFLQLALDVGTYYIEVGDFFGEIQDGQNYILNISIGPLPQPAPAPGVLALLGLGLAGIGFSRRKKQK